MVRLLSKLFGVHRTKSSKGWYGVTLGQFLELKAAGEGLTVEQALRVLYGVELRELPVGEIGRYSLEFLKKDVPKERVRDRYKLGGQWYTGCFDLTKVTAAQFFDFRNYAKKDDFVGVLSCCLVPEGKEYNEGYDMEAVKSAIREMPITQAQTIGFFFKNQLVILLRCILSSSKQTLAAIPEMSGIAKMLDEVDLRNLMSSL